MNIKVSEVAKLMGKSEQFVRIGLQRGLLPIGTAIKNGSKYSYYISPKLLEEYIGKDIKGNERNKRNDEYTS
jgi:hypothetical protein